MKKFQIAFVGINSLYGSTSALLLKQSPFIKCLKLFDPKDVDSGLDVATINTECKVKTFQGHEQLENAFREADIIVISDESNEMGDTDAHLMNVSANLTKYAKAISRASPDAIIVVASPPVNCLLPIMSQLLAKAGCYNHNKVVGSTSVDTMRASALLASQLNMNPKEVVLPVIGGSSEFTRVPVFSQSRPHFSLKKDLKNNLIMDIRRGDSLILANKGSPEALNRAYSTVRFLNSIMAGLRGEPNVTDITLCRTDLVPGVEYFSLPVMFGRDGIIKRFGVPNTSATEDEMVEEAVKHVKKDIDKADFIVKGTIELPEHKYLSSNDRSSSQKEMFDLFVKCLPKPQDNHKETIKENISKKVPDYSFKSLIKEDPSKDPFEVFDKKSSGRALATKLKNVTSADSFLKSAGCYTSPLQKPILILEPLGCPSRPLETDEDRELEEFLESEDVLHENNLARFRDKETYGEHRSRNSVPSPTKNQPFLSADIVQQKTVDPIANFKAQVAQFHEYRKHESERKIDDLEERNSPDEATEELEEHELQTDKTKSTTTAINVGSNKKKCKPINVIQNRTPNLKKDEIREDLFTIPKDREVHFSSPSGRCMKKKYNRSNQQTDSYVFDIKTNRIIPPYNLYKKGKNGKVDYLPEEENGKSYIPTSEVEESLYNRGRLEGTENDEKYKKLVSRLFKKLNGLNSGSFFPLKTTVEDRVNAPKCNKSFTESVVRCRSPNSAALKIRKKQKKSMTTIEGGNNEDFPQEVPIPEKKSRHNEENVMQEMRSQSKKSQRETAKFKDIEDLTLHSHTHQVEKPCENTQVQFVCPKCRIKVTCQPEKDVEETKLQKPDRVVSDIPQQDDRKPQRNVVMKSYKVRDSQNSTQNEVFSGKTQYEVNMLDERLKKLREKINKKLIPMMRQSGTDSANIKDDHGIPRDTTYSKSRACETGTPVVLARKVEPSAKCSEAPELKSNTSDKWQGVPFVVKGNENKSEQNDGRNRAVFMEVVVPPAYKGAVKSEGKRTKSQLKKTINEVEGATSKLTKSPLKKTINEVEVTTGKSVTVEAESKNAEEALKLVESNGKTGKRAAKILNKLQLLELEGRRKVSMEETQDETQEKNESDKLHKEQLRKEVSVDLKADEVRNYMMTRQTGSRNVLVRESSKDKTQETQVAVFEKIDFEHLKSETVKDISPEIFEPKPTIHDTNNSQMATDCKVEQSTGSNKDMENKNSAMEGKTANSDGKASATTERQVLRDDKARKDTGNETKAEKSNKESCWTMTSPSKNFENIEEPTMSPSKVENMSAFANSDKPQATLKIQNAADKKATQKLEGSTKPTSEPSNALFNKTPNKLQLLAKVRNSKQNDLKIKLQKKIKNVWEKVLSEKPVLTKFELAELPRILKHVGAAFDKLDKKSAAVKMAKKNTYSAPKKSNLYKTKRAAKNNVAILDGLTFPARRKRKPTNNLLKELASVSKRREQMKPMKPKANLKGVVKRVSVKPLTLVRAGKTDRYEGKKAGTSLEPRSSEYAQDEVQVAKLATEILKKKTLRSAFDVKNREWSKSKDLTKTEKQRRGHKQQLPRNFVSVERPRSSLLEIQTKDRKDAQAAEKSSEVMNKLMSMPHVRHQVENFELPLGPLEVQPGLAQFNYTKLGVFSPVKSEGGWESSIFNEYSRSNALPSLRDTRETFYLEEHPS